MTLTLSLLPEVELKLRRRAAATGQDVSAQGESTVIGSSLTLLRSKGPPVKNLLTLVIALFGLGGTTQPSQTFTIRNDDDHNRLYRSACDIIQPYMRLAGVPDKKVTKEAAAELQRAVRMLDAVTDYAPTNWSAFWVKGKAYQALDDRKAACAAFKSAFDLQDKNPDVAREYMFECLDLGDGAEGLRAARHALALKPSDAGLHANLALALVIAAKPKEALVAIDEALRLDPQDKISQNVREVVLKIVNGAKPQPKTLRELEK